MDHLLTVANGVSNLASAAADAIMAESPELHRGGLKVAIERELWLTVKDITLLAREGTMVRQGMTTT